MFALRRAAALPLHSPLPYATRFLATVSSSSPASPLQGKQAQPTTGRKKRKDIVPRRPNISLANPREWNRPVGQGALPAYDEALKYIQDDSRAIKSQVRELTAKIEAMQELNEAERDEQALIELNEKRQMLVIQSEINLPSVRWKFANGMGDFSKPIYRHLAVQKWKNMGSLDLLMERIHQMNVVPDVLPSLHPSFELRVTFPEAPPKSVFLRTRVRRKYREVEPGSFLLPEQTRRPPRLYTSVFHPEIRYYTMLLIDPDVPDPEKNGFTSYLHWMQPNIPLSATSTSAVPAYPHTRWVPPHPQSGTPYHRYTLLFLPNPNPTEKLPIPVVSDVERLGFSVRDFCQTYGINSAQGGAAHMWREVWDETVSHIYTHTFKTPEPKYGVPRLWNSHSELKVSQKYVL